LKQDLIKIYTVRTPEGIKNIASLISQEIAFEKGLLPESIIGYFTKEINNEELHPEDFVRNTLFVEILHKSIAEYAPRIKSFQATAQKLENGWVYVIDQRTPDPAGNVPPEDIISAFEIRKGEVIEGSYKPNDNHRILSPKGFCGLDVELYEYLIDKLQKLYELSARQNA
jgi:hypothetical protein